MNRGKAAPAQPQNAARVRVLVVEDDVKIADMLANYLGAQGYSVSVCGNGLQAIEAIKAAPPHMVLLDLMLPGADGIAVCTAVRAFSDVPIIMITARVDELDRLIGLETGADDYMCKPVSVREVVARIKALLRRTQGHGVVQAMPPTDALSVDDSAQSIRYLGKSLPLTPVEFRLLRLLLSRPNHVFGRARLLDEMHQDFKDVGDRAIDSHIKNIRRKMDAAGANPDCIVSVYGVGYRLDS